MPFNLASYLSPFAVQRSFSEPTHLDPYHSHLYLITFILIVHYMSSRRFATVRAPQTYNTTDPAADSRAGPRLPTPDLTLNG